MKINRIHKISSFILSMGLMLASSLCAFKVHVPEVKVHVPESHATAHRAPTHEVKTSRIKSVAVSASDVKGQTGTIKIANSTKKTVGGLASAMEPQERLIRARPVGTGVTYDVRPTSEFKVQTVGQAQGSSATGAVQSIKGATQLKSGSETTQGAMRQSGRAQKEMLYANPLSQLKPEQREQLVKATQRNVSTESKLPIFDLTKVEASAKPLKSALKQPGTTQSQKTVSFGQSETRTIPLEGKGQPLPPLEPNSGTPLRMQKEAAVASWNQAYSDKPIPVQATPATSRKETLSTIPKSQLLTGESTSTQIQRILMPEKYAQNRTQANMSRANKLDAMLNA